VNRLEGGKEHSVNDVGPLAIAQFSGPGYRGCRLTGEIDFTSTGPVQATLSGMILPGGGTVVVDLSRVDFIDSSGLGALVQANRIARERQTRLIVVASPPVRRLLAVTALDTVLEIVDDLAAAERSITAPNQPTTS
jgi:anti-sigma B factor antagonist